MKITESFLMKCSVSLRWSVWISLLLVGLLQTYVIYRSVSRYTKLKREIFLGHHKDFVEFQWGIPLLNVQLFMIVGALGAFPFWIYCTVFCAASLLCGTDTRRFDRRGFNELVWQEALDLYGHLQTDKTTVSSHSYARSSCCQRRIKPGLLYPIASMLQVFMAYSLLVPVPFIEAWLIHIGRVNKDEMATSDVDFLVPDDMMVKIKWSSEYFNFLISVTILSLQYPNLIWRVNKLFSITFTFLELLIIFHILLDFPIISTVIKKCLKHNKIYTNSTFGPLYYSAVLLASSVIGNIFFIFTGFLVFQFAYEKCVQTLIGSSWFISNYPSELASSTNNSQQLSTQTNANYSALYSADRVRNIKTSVYPLVCDAVLFLFGCAIKSAVYFKYQDILIDSKLFIIYLIQSFIFVTVYFMFWFGMSLKPKWSFSMKEFEKRRTSSEIIIPREEPNYYRSLKNNLKPSQISLPIVSNKNLVLQSNHILPTNNRLDFTSGDNYLNKTNSLRLPVQSQDYNDYIQLNHYSPPPRLYKTMQPSVSSPRPFAESPRDYKSFLMNYYKCANTFPSNNSSENIRYEEPYQINKRSNKEFCIPEEPSNDNISSISDDVSSNMTQSPKMDLTNRNNQNMKFVTFRLDNNAEISAEISSTGSNESLTVISLEQSEAFLKELDGDGSNKIHFEMFKKERNSDFRDKFMFPVEDDCSNSLSLSTLNQTKASLL